jgi:5-methylcytosine-specific restriction endonuclease McrA
VGKHTNRYIDASDASELWSLSRKLPCIKLPNGRIVTPRELREDFIGKSCQCCNRVMADYSDDTITYAQSEAEKRGWFVTDHEGKKRYTKMGPNKFCAPHCVTLDHKLPKSKYPQLMFNFENLQIWCAGCNTAKLSSVTYEFELTRKEIQNRVKVAIAKIRNL